MSEIKNKVITISGEPASGKSTVIEQLKRDYEAMGYTVHIYSIGHEFRKRAQERGLSVGEFNKFVEGRKDIDKIIDKAVALRGEEINSKERPKEVFIFDSRLAFHNIPSSFSVRLTVDSNVAGKRVFGDNRRGEEDRYTTVEEATAQTIARKKSEIERYLKAYEVNLQDPENYNLLIDTSFSSVEDIARVIEQCLELNLQDKRHAKTWTSPKTLLPLQEVNQTWGDSLASCALEEMEDKLKKEGYDPNSTIEIIEAYGRRYIIDGHHRNFAAGYIGITLVPYIIVAKDNQTVPHYGDATANRRAASLSSKYLFDHEEFFDQKDAKGRTIRRFSYNNVYPGIYQELRERDGR